MHALFFFNDTATTEIYTLSLHDALPILTELAARRALAPCSEGDNLGNLLAVCAVHQERIDRKSTRLNSSHANISYAVFCLKKKTDSDKVLASAFAGRYAMAGNGDREGGG